MIEKNDSPRSSVNELIKPELSLVALSKEHQHDGKAGQDWPKHPVHTDKNNEHVPGRQPDIHPKRKADCSNSALDLSEDIYKYDSRAKLVALTDEEKYVQHREEQNRRTTNSVDKHLSPIINRTLDILDKVRHPVRTFNHHQEWLNQQHRQIVKDGYRTDLRRDHQKVYTRNGY